MIRTIVTDRKQLSKKCRLIVAEEDYSKIVEDLKDSFNALKQKGFGLSANQIGIDAAISYIKYGEKELVLINPKIVDLQDSFKFEGEGCFSFPGIKVVTKRYNKIKIVTVDGEQEYTGLLAVILQHEIDHLFGLTMFDKKWKAR